MVDSFTRGQCLARRPGTDRRSPAERIGGVQSARANCTICRITGVGLDLRYPANGVLRETRLFRGMAAGTETVETALTKRQELEAKGWRASQ
jgi:hypothetical protein